MTAIREKIILPIASVLYPEQGGTEIKVLKNIAIPNTTKKKKCKKEDNVVLFVTLTHLGMLYSIIMPSL
jgi:hypothetical protein